MITEVRWAQRISAPLVVDPNARYANKHWLSHSSCLTPSAYRMA